MKYFIVENLITTKGKLLTFLNNISKSNQSISGVFGLPTAINDGINTMYQYTTKYPGILTIIIPSYSHITSEWVTFTNTVISKWKEGYLIHIIWWVQNFPLTTSNKNLVKNTPGYSENQKFNSLIQEDGEINSAYKKDLDLIVPYLKQMETAGVIPICSFIQAVNYKGFWWTGRTGINGSAKLFRMTHNYLTQHHNLHFLVWSWHLFSNGDMTHLEEYWPGDYFVDVIAVEMQSNRELPSSQYTKLLEIVGDKPIAMDLCYLSPSVHTINEQQRWTWFTIHTTKISTSGLNYTVNNDVTINKPNVTLFSLS